MKHSATLPEECHRRGTDMGHALPWRASAAKCATCLCSSRPMGECACTSTSLALPTLEHRLYQTSTLDSGRIVRIPCSDCRYPRPPTAEMQRQQSLLRSNSFQ